MNPLTQQGIAAYKAGNKAEARKLLKQAIQQDAADIPAWLCLAGALDGAAEQAYCFQMVLRLDPYNTVARNGMRAIDQSRGKVTGQEPGTASADVPAQPDFRRELLYTAPFTTDYEEGQDVTRPETAAEPAAKPAQVLAAVPEKTPPLPQAQPAPALKGAGARSARKSPRRKKSAIRPWMWAIFGGMALLILVAVLVLVGMLSNRPAADQAALVKAQSSTSTPTIGLPPTNTPTVTPTPLATRTLAPTPTATYMVLGPAIASKMANIQNEASGLRGLPLQRAARGYLVTQTQAEDLLRGQYITGDTLAGLENQQRALAILGLVQPSYDLANLALNQVVENLGAFYLPDQKQIYILSAPRFDGVEQWVYSHELDHAIIDQYFDIRKLQDCPADTQRCQAVKALIEGDAQLLMSEWVKQYTNPQMNQDFLNYHPPAMALPAQQPPPAYLVEQMAFPYNQGLDFVSYLFKRGSWGAVNRAYASPPASTEQILHPEKYIAGESPIPVFAQAVETALGGGWQGFANDTLGEWTTFLLLYRGAKEAAQLTYEESYIAAAGWGGDHYQAYYSPSTGKTSLVVQWAWDSPQDGDEFEMALKKHLAALYSGNAPEQPGADCWQTNSQVTCVISRPALTLWLTAPDLATVKAMWALYPEFK